MPAVMLHIKEVFAPIGRAGSAQRYYLLDGMRGLAALAIIFHHYIMLFVAPLGPLPKTDDGYPAQPFYAQLNIIYNHGNFAVPIFWMLSGFVFAAVYPAGSTTSRSFVVNRFARLYPLHFLTLLIVAVLQFLAIRQYGVSLLYPNNDLYHFLLQLFLASNWWTAEFSYNGPIWSISVEILIYAIFWICHRKLLSYGAVLPFALALVFLGLTRFEPLLQIGRCGFAFFAGSGCYALHRIYRGRNLVIIVACLAAMILAVPGFMTGRPPIIRFFSLPMTVGALMLLMANFDHYCTASMRKICELMGDNTYGMYLWHIPLQLMILLGLSRFTKVSDLALSPWFLAFYALLVVGVARLSFVYFERPARDYLRQFSKRRGGFAVGGDPLKV
jgi:peptidoglycan/LPS O-acetylase OafA/YrhL